MEPIVLAGMAIKVLLPLLSKAKDQLSDTMAGELADSVTGAAAKVYELVKRRLSGDAYDEAVLAGVEDKPDNATRVRVLEERLAELIAEDPEFAAVLRDRVSECAPQGDAVTVHADRSGVTAGGSVTQHAGGDIVGRDKTVRR